MSVETPCRSPTRHEWPCCGRWPSAPKVGLDCAQHCVRRSLVRCLEFVYDSLTACNPLAHITPSCTAAAAGASGSQAKSSSAGAPQSDDTTVPACVGLKAVPRGDGILFTWCVHCTSAACMHLCTTPLNDPMPSLSMELCGQQDIPCGQPCIYTTR